MTPSSAPDDSIRRRNADQESLLPGLAYAGAAAIGGAVLVNHARSMPVKILTPLAMATVTGAYFLPAHAELVKSKWTRRPFVARRMSSDEGPLASVDDQKLTSSNMAALDLPQTKSMNDPSSYQQQQEEEGQQVKEQAKSWLDPWRLDSEKSLRTESGGGGGGVGAQNKFHGINMNQSIPENPSSSRWSWWTRSERMTPKGERDTKIQVHSEEPATAGGPPTSTSMTSERVERPFSTSTTVKTTTMRTNDAATAEAAQESVLSQQQLQQQQQQEQQAQQAQQQQGRESITPRKAVVDKAVASAAVKGHDDIINRDSWIGKNTEETALKVHDNVIDAALPKHRQSRHESHPIELTRQASQSDMKDGKFVVRESQDLDGPPPPTERVRRKSLKASLHHGLENQERRSSMMFKGVENLEHSINKRIQKALEEEADFWHQESMKEQANARGGERGM